MGYIMNRVYIAIDLKSFYASVECVERGLDPLDTNLVVADESRTEKTICLAVSPSLKAYGIPGRARLFEVVQAAKSINADRRFYAPSRSFTGKSFLAGELAKDPSLELDYIVAKPRMAYYMKYSTDIYKIYLKYVSADDIQVYSVDEVFMDVTQYLRTYKMTPRQLASTIMKDVLEQTGITATAGIGTNLYLAKVAMDVMAKHIPADENGARIAELDEMSYRRELWSHRPVTDFWRVGSGTAKKLSRLGLYTMGDVAAYSEYGEDTLYKIFGVNAELLIDHAWGWEPCTIDYIKQYKPQSNSLSMGQVLQRPYAHDEAGIIVWEMADHMALSLVSKRLVTKQMTLTIGYEGLKDPDALSDYKGETGLDRYGRTVPKHAHSTANLDKYTSSSRLITSAITDLYEKITDKNLMIRRITVTACGVISEDNIPGEPEYEQLNIFTDYKAWDEQKKEEEERLKKEKAMQLAQLKIKKRYGKNAILKGTNFLEGATERERNAQIGGHKA